jgi:hypothetical protein
MRVLVACEFSGIVRDAFAALGHDAWSCDLLPTERPGQHIQDDVLQHLGDGWDLMVAHPPCTYLTRNGAPHWSKPGWHDRAEQAFAFVTALWQAPVSRMALENPIGRLNRWWRYPDQVIQPFYFGHPYSKRTCLWLRGLPPLMATQVVAEHQPWAQGNYVDRATGQLRAGGKVRSSKDRSRTFPGIAAAMAAQWG